MASTWGLGRQFIYNVVKSSMAADQQTVGSTDKGLKQVE